MQSRQLRAAIFDFDGTIADTFEEVVRVLNGLAPEFGFRVADQDEVALLRNLSPAEVAKRLGVPWRKIPVIVTRARREMSHRMSKVQPFAGIPEALAELRAHGLQVGLLTSNNRTNVELFLAQHPIAFDFTSTGSGLWSKHRRLAKLLRQQGIAREHVAYVGDEVRDIDAARTIGVHAVSVAWGFTSPQLLAAQQPARVVARVSELATDLIALLGEPPVVSS